MARKLLLLVGHDAIGLLPGADLLVQCPNPRLRDGQLAGDRVDDELVADIGQYSAVVVRSATTIDADVIAVGTSRRPASNR